MGKRIIIKSYANPSRMRRPLADFFWFGIFQPSEDTENKLAGERAVFPRQPLDVTTQTFAVGSSDSQRLKSIHNGFYAATPPLLGFRMPGLGLPAGFLATAPVCAGELSAYSRTSLSSAKASVRSVGNRRAE